MILPRGSIISITNGTLSGVLTEHGRQPVSIDIERIGGKDRMIDGTMRASYIAKKRSFTVTWQGVPTIESMLLDADVATIRAGKWIKDFYEATTGTVTVTLNFDGAPGPIEMLITGFNYDIDKRTYTTSGNFDLVNISMTLEEI